MRPALGGGVEDPVVDVVGGVWGVELDPRELASIQSKLHRAKEKETPHRESSLSMSACE